MTEKTVKELVEAARDMLLALTHRWEGGDHGAANKKWNRRLDRLQAAVDRMDSGNGSPGRSE